MNTKFEVKTSCLKSDSTFVDYLIELIVRHKVDGRTVKIGNSQYS
jgi:hypothetical protein